MPKTHRVLVIPRNKDHPKKEVVELLRKASVLFEKAEVELIGNEPVVWITTAQEKNVKNALRKADMKSFASDVVTIKLPDKPGELAKIARILMSSNITVKDAHLILKSEKDALYGITTNRPRETAKIVEKLTAFLEKEGS